MNIININESHYIIDSVVQGKYKISFCINGAFHIRFSIHDSENQSITKYCTKTIYSDVGTYSFVIDTVEGLLCLECTQGRANNWTEISNLTLEEMN